MEPGGRLPPSHKPATYPYAELDQSALYSHPTSPRYFLKLSSHLCLGIPSCLFLSGSLTDTKRHDACLLYLSILDLITRIIFCEEQIPRGLFITYSQAGLLLLCLSTWRDPRVFMNVSMQEHHAFDKQVVFFYLAKFTIPKPLSLQSSCKLSFPTTRFKIPSLPNFALESPNIVFMWH